MNQLTRLLVFLMAHPDAQVFIARDNQTLIAYSQATQECRIALL